MLISKMEEKKVCVVIVTWNNKGDVLANLRSLEKVKYSNKTVVVVDNASIDGTEEAIKKEFPLVVLLVNKKNLGGSGGFNTGLTYALQKTDAEYVWMLDNDVIPHENSLIGLVTTIEKSPETGIVGSKIFVHGRPGILQEIGSILSFSYESARGHLAGSYDETGNSEEYDVDYVPACSLLIKRECLENTGIMDDRFFLYWDDMDLCTRVKRSGYKVMATTSSSVWHKHKGVTDTTTTSNYYFLRNKLYFFEHYNSNILLISSTFKTLQGIWAGILYWLWIGQPQMTSSIFRAMWDYLAGKRGKAPNIASIKFSCCEYMPDLGGNSLLIVASRLNVFIERFNMLKKSAPETKFCVLVNSIYYNVYKQHKFADSLISYPSNEFNIDKTADKILEEVRSQNSDSVVIMGSYQIFPNIAQFACSLGIPKVYHMDIFGNIKTLEGLFFFKIKLYATLIDLFAIITFPVFLGKRFFVKIKTILNPQ